MMTEEYKKYRELEGDFEQIIDIVIGNTQKMEYVKRQIRVLKVNLSEWNDGLLASTVGSENVGVENSNSSVAILNPHEARSRGGPRSNRFRSRRELNGGSNHGRSRGRRASDIRVQNVGAISDLVLFYPQSKREENGNRFRLKESDLMDVINHYSPLTTSPIDSLYFKDIQPDSMSLFLFNANGMEICYKPHPGEEIVHILSDDEYEGNPNGPMFTACMTTCD
ncbi:hypothetical protein GH714_019961 [Hevea brasiliensis]|uniref:Uncharacterized protein n=1 Tax=Hevea brasiliensis TaxID=3981 RepID=A0A6A6K5Z2_HEVBR|nr:hypothetical protein GH714_019961 [Hevea brasiliensis]